MTTDTLTREAHAANIRLKEIKKRRALIGKQRVELLTNSAGKGTVVVLNPSFFYFFNPFFVRCNPKRRHNRQQTNSKTTDKMPTLRKIKRAAMPPTSRHKLQHILFCPTAPKATHHPDNWTSGLLDKNGLNNGIKF